MRATGTRASSDKSGDKSQVQVIARAAAILRMLEDEMEGLSLGQIAQRVDLARSTVQRIVGALAAEKFLIAASPNGRVRLGPTILRLAASARTDFVAAARPFLAQLSSELKETVDLAVIKNDHLVFVDQVIGSQRLRTVSAVGETFPLYCTANGKAYLAELDAAAIERLIGTAYERRTPRTMTRLDHLLRDLKSVRKTGVAIDREEHTHGICAAGIVTRDPTGNFWRSRCRCRRSASTTTRRHRGAVARDQGSAGAASDGGRRVMRRLVRPTALRYNCTELQYRLRPRDEGRGKPGGRSWRKKFAE